MHPAARPGGIHVHEAFSERPERWDDHPGFELVEWGNPATARPKKQQQSREIPIALMGDEYMQRCKDYIDRIYPENDRPDWEELDSITTGIAKGGNIYHTLVWQGQSHWCVGDLCI